MTILGIALQVAQAFPMPTPAPTRLPPALLEGVQLIANLAILATAIFVWLQVKVAIRHLTELRTERKRSRALDYIRRWNEASDNPKKIAAYQACRDQSKSITEKLELLKNDMEMRSLIRAECNFFEELGVAHAKGLIEQDVAFAFFEGVVPDMHDSLYFWIEHRRIEYRKKYKKEASAVLGYFSALAEEYKKRSERT